MREKIYPRSTSGCMLFKTEMQNIFFRLLDMGGQCPMGGLLIAIFDRSEQRAVSGNGTANIVFGINALDAVTQHVAADAVGHLL